MQEQSQEKIKDIMSKTVVSVMPSTTVQDAAKLMQQNNIGSVPVVSGGEVKGILTDRDIILRCVAFGKDPSQVRSEDIMTSHVACLTPEQPVQDAMSMMATEQVRRLPVVENGVIQGIVSFSDVARRHTGPQVAEAIGQISQTQVQETWNDQNSTW